ncbi:FG-GAP repeat domain-containing protein, partial [Actinoplanes sp. NPDC049599]|uniref:FG-GAP repeat domain-containing protein n=1 Tax=Actinoplanes sp. NPDC049599 TaxID=3363903 RepID=UPI0037AA33C2
FAGVADYDRDGRQDIVARDNGTGRLWLYPGQSTRGYSSLGRFEIGNGWNAMTFAGVADYDRDGRQDIVARDNGTGRLWLYPGQSTRGYSSLGRFEIGNGWNAMTFADVADYDRDGSQDIVARDNGTGRLWLYPGQGTRGYSSLGRFEIGNGW